MVWLVGWVLRWVLRWVVQWLVGKSGIQPLVQPLVQRLGGTAQLVQDAVQHGALIGRQGIEQGRL